MQTFDDKQRLFLVHLHLFVAARIGERGVEPVVERFDGIENLWEHKVEQCPELGEVVLTRQLLAGARLNLEHHATITGAHTWRGVPVKSSLYLVV
jgi:hypothetical protein